MYRISKPKGVRASITITNEETYSSINIGAMNSYIAEAFKKHDESYDASKFALTEEWNSIEINDDLAKDLMSTCMRAHKPVRVTKKVSERDVITPDNAQPAVAEKTEAQRAYDFLMGYSDEL